MNDDFLQASLRRVLSVYVAQLHRFIIAYNDIYYRAQIRVCACGSAARHLERHKIARNQVVRPPLSLTDQLFTSLPNPEYYA